MAALKTSGSIFGAIIACLMLLLMPASDREETSGSKLPAMQELTSINRKQTAFHFAREPLAATESDEASALTQDKSEYQVDSPTETQSIDWSLALYPELARIAELENQPVDTALVELLPMLSNDDPVIRLAAIESLGDMTSQATIPALSAALNDSNPQLRIAALEALAAQEDKSAAGSIESYLYDPDKEVRVAAIGALVDLESETSVYAFAGLLSDPDLSIRLQALDALGEIGGEYALMYLLQARNDPDASIRANVEAILAEAEI